MQDQIRAMRKTRRQSMNTDMEKQRRMRRPSMLFADIQKLESLVRVAQICFMVRGCCLLWANRWMYVTFAILMNVCSTVAPYAGEGPNGTCKDSEQFISFHGRSVVFSHGKLQ